MAVALAAHGPPLDRRAFYHELARDCREEEFVWQLRAARRLRAGHSLAFLGNGLPAHRSVVTAIACFTAHPDSFERCMETAIALGDDTDTLAAMAGAFSGAYLGISGVPARWIEELEAGPRGTVYLRTIADDLWRLHERLVADRSGSTPEQNQTAEPRGTAEPGGERLNRECH